jgi:hypothetical protein
MKLQTSRFQNHALELIVKKLVVKFRKNVLKYGLSRGAGINLCLLKYWQSGKVGQPG